MPDFSQDDINKEITDYLKDPSSQVTSPSVPRGSAFSELFPYVTGPVAGGLLAKAAASKPLLGMLTALPRKLKSAYPITAYHASPHKFDQFDLSKVGTGQGVQSYGHGIYTAESPLVSGRGGEYDKEFTGKNLGSRIYGNDALTLSMMAHGYSDSDMVNHFVNKGYTPEWAKFKVDQINDAKSHIYEVGINAHPSQFLRWDQPFRSNSQEVRDKINAAKSGWPSMGRIIDIEGGMVEPGISEPGMVMPNIYGDQLYHNIGTYPELSTERLLKAGIPGIRYLDQGSRDKNIFPVRSGATWSLMNAGRNEWPTSHEYDNFFDAQKAAEALEASSNPTYNYVLFNDKLMDILKRYGIAGAAATPAISSISSDRNGVSQ